MGILGVILGILAALCAVMATFMYGIAGGIAAGVLGAAAIALGILKRRKEGKGGLPSIVIGAIAIILAISMTGAWSNVFRELHLKAVELKPDGLWAQISEDTSGGFAGLIKNMPQDEASMNALMEEMNELNKLTEGQ